MSALSSSVTLVDHGCYCYIILFKADCTNDRNGSPSYGNAKCSLPFWKWKGIKYRWSPANKTKAEILSIREHRQGCPIKSPSAAWRWALSRSSLLSNAYIMLTCDFCFRKPYHYFYLLWSNILAFFVTSSPMSRDCCLSVLSISSNILA